MNSRQLLGALSCGALMLAATPPVRAEGTFDIPAGAHFNRAKLEKITEFFKNEVATGKTAGANVLIRQRGKDVYHETFGVQDVVSKTPITDKTIFRLSSLTKAITSVVAMQLIQDGKINLDDPVSKYIPSFANMKVGVEKKAEDGTKTLELVPLTRPITVLDLMRHTSGITYGFYGDSLVRKAYKEANIYAGDFDLAEFAERIAKLPLHNQPGALWQYGHSTDILARIMEIVSGKSLLEIERQMLLDPLGMTDTGFFVTDPEKQKLIAQPVPNDSDFRVGRQYRIEVRQKWESASGGMVSTMSDFSRFAQMLLDGGKFEGKTYLSPKTFELMTTDYVGPGSGVGRDYFYFPGDGFGMGLGLAVRTDPGNARPPPPGSLGELKWDGASGCYMVIDRKQDMLFVLLEQTPSERQRVQRTLKQLVYESLEN
jgi:CubicO group peptidase (beta-lactamase class C family)